MNRNGEVMVGRPPVWNVWIQAIRPATLSASVVPVMVGVAQAMADGMFRFAPAGCALLGALFIQIGTNLANDYFDFANGADTDKRIGPARVTQRGWLKPRDVALAAFVAFFGAALSGVYLVYVAGWPILIVGLLSIVCGIWYTAGSRPLGYIGLGDVLVFVFFGPVAIMGTYFVQTHAWSERALLASIPIGLLSSAILVVNNLRDRHTDMLADKKTLVVRWGERFGRWEFTLLVLGAYVCLPVFCALGRVGLTWMLPLLALPHGMSAIRSVWGLDGSALNPLLGQSARLVSFFGLMLIVGML